MVQPRADLHELSTAECTLILAMILHDAGWCTMRPEVALPAAAVAVSLQASKVASLVQRRSFSLAIELSILIWLTGNAIWTGCELVWDEGKPAGFLAYVRALAKWDAKWYPVGMEWAVCTMVLASASMALFHLSRFVASGVRLRARTLREQDVMGCQAAASQADAGDDRAFGCLPCLPLDVYLDLAVLPWIIMDTSWAYQNLRQTRGADPLAGLLCCATLLGLAAVAIECDCIRRYRRHGAFAVAALSAAEMTWIAGNIVWMLGDLLTDDGWPIWAGFIFSVGAIAAVYAMSHADREARAGPGSCVADPTLAESMRPPTEVAVGA